MALFLCFFYRHSTIYDISVTDVATGWSADFNHQQVGGADNEGHEF